MRKWLILAVALCCPASIHAAPTGESDAFNKLFGKAYDSAKVSHDPAVKEEFVERLLDAGDGLKDDAELQSQVYFHAYDLAMTDAGGGYPLAQEAMEMLRVAQPDKKPQADVKLLAVLSKEYQTAQGNDKPVAAATYLARVSALAEEEAHDGHLTDAAKTYSAASSAASSLGPKVARAVATRIAVFRKLDTDQQHLATSPDPKLAAESGLALALELNRPSQAVSVYPPAGEAAPMIALAAMAIDSLDEKQCTSLGDWYSANAEKRTEFGKLADLENAIEYYMRALSLHAPEDASHARLKLLVSNTKENVRGLKNDLHIVVATNAKVTVVSDDDWIKKYAPAFPVEKNLGMNGTAKASATGGNSQPATTILTRKRGDGGYWESGVGNSTMDITWARPVVARFIIIKVAFGDFGNKTTFSLNGQAPHSLPAVPAGSSIIIDLQHPAMIKSAYFDIVSARGNSALTYLEIHRSALSVPVK